MSVNKKAIVLFLSSIFICACTSAPNKSESLSFHISPPTEADAIQMHESFPSKQAARKEFGEPAQIKTLKPTGSNKCVERWFYKGTVDVEGLGPIEMLTYTDFDAEGKTCGLQKGAKAQQCAPAEVFAFASLRQILG